MSNYIVNKEREKIDIPINNENKEREKIEIKSIVNQKEKSSLETTAIINQKEKNTINSPIIETTKTKLSFSPLKIEEEKTTKIVPSVSSSDKKISSSLPTYKEEVQKSKITLDSKLSEKKKNFTLETVTTKIERMPPSFSPLNIGRSKDSPNLESHNVYLSKARGNALAYSEPIASKDKTPLFADITEGKEKEEIVHEQGLVQKEGDPLYSSITEEKNDYKLENPESSIKKEDTNLNNEFSLSEKEDKELEEFMLQNKELFGITGKITKEDKDKLALIIPAIENLSTNGKIDPNKKIKEEKTGKWWEKAKDWLEELLGFNLEIATLKSLLMPPELDKLLSDVKTLKGNVYQGNIVDSTVGAFNLTNQLYNNISHFTLGEMAGLYATNFFTITGFKPSPSIKNPGRKQIGDDEWTGGVLLNSDNPFGSIEDDSNTTLRKLGRFTDLRGLKNFGISQIGNLLTGRNRKKEDDEGEVVYNKTTSKWEFKYNKDRWRLNSGNFIGDTAKANNAHEEPSAVQTIMGSMEHDEVGDGWPTNIFDPAIRLGSSALKEVTKTDSAIRDGLSFVNQAIDQIIDVGNIKANTLKEQKTKTLLNPAQKEALKIIGVNPDKLIKDFGGVFDYNTLINKFGLNQKTDNDFFNKLEEKEIKDTAITNNGKLKDEFGRGYNIPAVNSPEDEPIINLHLGSEMKGEDLDTLRNSIKKNFLSIKTKNDYNIGYMIVEPADFTGKFERFKIDFEFNPEIDEGSLKANYDKVTILNRIGQLETYVGTDSITPSMKLKYRVLSRDPRKGNSWMSKWTIEYIQQIEMALRALTVPASIENRTTRPPVLRIELGSHSNLFKFPILTNQSQKWRYFIATDVKINKFYDGSSYCLGSEKYPSLHTLRSFDGLEKEDLNLYAYDTMGFDAEISLTEVKKSYFSYYPNFNDYYDSIVQNSNQNTLQYFLLPKGVN